MIKLIENKLSIFLLLGFLLAPSYSYAKSIIKNEDVQLINNSLKYIRGLDSKNVVINALYNPANKSSKSEAQSFVTKLKNSKKGAKFTAQTVSVKNIGKQKNGSIYYLPSGVEGYSQKVVKASKDKKILVIGRDKKCVENRVCSISFNTDAGVNIYLGERVLKESGFDVDATFKFMVNRI